MHNPYATHAIALKRLTDEYSKHGGLVIAYDFDNTV